MEFKIPVNKDNIHKAILTVVNFNLGLSELELDILATLLKNNLYLVDSKAREVVRKVLNKDKFQTNNYLLRLKKKGVIVQAGDNKKWYLNPNLKGLINTDSITFKFDATN